MRGKVETGRGRNKETVPELHAPNLQNPTLRECLFSADENPAINVLKAGAYWLIMHWPDFMGWFDWKRTVRKLVTVFIILYLASTLLFNFSIQGMIFRIFAMTAFAAVLYGKNTGFLIYGFLEKWESFEGKGQL
jgi:hypothetical protein